MEWKLADTKDRLSEVVTRATTDGPQTIRRHDAAVVVFSETTHRQLTGEKPNFNDWLLNGPRIDDLDLPPRSESPLRKLDL